MGRVYHDDEVVPPDAGGLEALRVVLVQVGQGNVQLLFLYQRRRPGGAVLVEGQADIGVAGIEIMEQVREKGGSPQGRNAHLHVLLGAAQGAELLLCGLHLPQKLLGALIEDAPLVRQGHLVPGVGKETDGKFLLQLPDGPGNGRLGHIQLFRRRRNALAFHGGAEILQLCQFHGWTPFRK